MMTLMKDLLMGAVVLVVGTSGGVGVIQVLWPEAELGRALSCEAERAREAITGQPALCSLRTLAPPAAPAEAPPMINEAIESPASRTAAPEPERYQRSEEVELQRPAGTGCAPLSVRFRRVTSGRITDAEGRDREAMPLESSPGVLLMAQLLSQRCATARRPGAERPPDAVNPNADEQQARRLLELGHAYVCVDDLLLHARVRGDDVALDDAGSSCAARSELLEPSAELQRALHAVAGWGAEAQHLGARWRISEGHAHD